LKLAKTTVLLPIFEAKESPMEQSYQPDFDKMIRSPRFATSEAEIMAEIRKVMVADKVEHPEVVKKQAHQPKPAVQVAVQKAGLVASPVVGPVAGSVTGVVRSAKRYQPRWSHNLLILALAVIIYTPIGTAVATALFLATLLVVSWLVGADRLRTFGRACFGLYHRAFPIQAGRMVDWANGVSDPVQALSGRLPTRWTQGLYMPSFSNEPDADLDLVEPFERLLAERQGDRQTTIE